MFVIILPYLEEVTIGRASHPYLSAERRWIDFAVDRGAVCVLPIPVYKCPSVAR